MLGIISKLVLSKTFDDYHSLSDNLVESEHYEIKKLINGDIDAILYSKETNSVLVMAGRYLWKINDKGYVTDTFSGTSDLQGSGIQLSTDRWSNGTDENYWLKRFNDWLYTGDKSEHTINDFIESNNLTDAQLISRFDKADVVEFFTFHKEKINNAELKISLLKEKNRWTALNITGRFGEVDETCKEYKNNNQTIWRESCLEGYVRKQAPKLIALQDNLPYKPDFEDETQPLHIKKFVKDFYYYEEGFGSWLGMNILGKTLLSGLPGSLPGSYWFGTGYFQLTHNAEPLNFKAFVSNEDGRTNFSNISIYNLPGGVNDAMKFIKITYKGGEHDSYHKIEKVVKYHENDVGLYVIRKKASLSPEAIAATNKSNIHFGQRPTYYTHNPWLPVFTGKFIQEKSRNSIWGDIVFFNTEDDPYHYLLNAAAVPAGLHSIPRTLTFSWEGRGINSAYKLYLNDENFVWLDLNRFTNDVFFELNFDEAEIIEAFKQLDSKGQPLQLEMHMAEIEKTSAKLLIRLRSDKESVELKHVTYKYAEPVYGGDDKKQAIVFEKDKLKIQFERAMLDKKYLHDYMEISTGIASNSPHVKEYASFLIGQSNELINKNTGTDDKVTAEKIVYHFINDLLPYTGRVGKKEEVAINIEIIASNSLAFAILTKNDDLSSIVFEKLLGPDFNIAALKNKTLLFNLACYHAVHNEKGPFLEAMRQSLKLGMTADKFMSDADFKDYWNDAEFKNTLVIESQVDTKTKSAE